VLDRRAPAAVVTRVHVGAGQKGHVTGELGVLRTEPLSQHDLRDPLRISGEARFIAKGVESVGIVGVEFDRHSAFGKHRNWPVVIDAVAAIDLHEKAERGESRAGRKQSGEKAERGESGAGRKQSGEKAERGESRAGARAAFSA